MTNRISYPSSLVVMMVAILALTGSVLAQGPEPTTPLALSDAPLVLNFSAAGTGPPTIEPLTDGRIAFNAYAEGSISGALEGTIQSAITEVVLEPALFHPTSIRFTLETENGTLEGYYAGMFHLPEPGAPAATINGYGQILSVSGAYADLWLAEVYVASQVHFEGGGPTGESGTMTIAAR